MRYLMYQPAMSDTANPASTRRQARTDGGGGGEKESSVSLCQNVAAYRACVGRRVFTAILPGLSLPPHLSTISTAAVVSSTSFFYIIYNKEKEQEISSYAIMSTTPPVP